jgi:hypothetical protein
MYSFILFFLHVSQLAFALPTGSLGPRSLGKKSFSLPITSRAGGNGRLLKRDGGISGGTGLGDFLDEYVAWRTFYFLRISEMG